MTRVSDICGDLRKSRKLARLFNAMTKNYSHIFGTVRPTNLRTCTRTRALELILEWGRRGEALRAESGGRVLGEGTASPSPPTRGFAGAL